MNELDLKRLELQLDHADHVEGCNLLGQAMFDSSTSSEKIQETPNTGG